MWAIGFGSLAQTRSEKFVCCLFGPTYVSRRPKKSSAREYEAVDLRFARFSCEFSTPLLSPQLASTPLSSSLKLHFEGQLLSWLNQHIGTKFPCILNHTLVTLSFVINHPKPTREKCTFNLPFLG